MNVNSITEPPGDGNNDARLPDEAGGLTQQNEQNEQDEADFSVPTRRTLNL